MADAVVADVVDVGNAMLRAKRAPALVKGSRFDGLGRYLVVERDHHAIGLHHLHAQVFDSRPRQEPSEIAHDDSVGPRGDVFARANGIETGRACEDLLGDGHCHMASLQDGFTQASARQGQRPTFRQITRA
jgi:hypothetical protein